MQWTRDDGFFVTDDPSRLDLERVHTWLSEQTYWAAGRSLERVAESLRHSLVVTCWDNDQQVGMARWVTDQVSFAWLSDVFVDSSFRGRGLGKFVVACALDHPGVRGVRRLMLGTRDAHELYEQFGFSLTTAGARLMEKNTHALDTREDAV